ncbi:MAG: VWA domain-containing protein [Polyangia bacterium]
MTEALVEFIALLRKNGARISTAETLDALQAAAVVSLADREALRAALSCTLAKRATDRELFEELFTLYFHERGSVLDGGEESPLAEALRRSGVSEDEIARITALLADEASRMQPLMRAAMGLRRGQIEALLRLAQVKVDWDRLTSPLQVGYFTQQVLEGLGFNDAYAEAGNLAKRLARAVGQERADQLAGFVDENLRKLRTSARSHVKRELDKREVDHRAAFVRDILALKPFGAMSPEELNKLRDEVERLALKLKAQASLRRKVTRRGRLDFRRTMRAAMATGGVPFRPVWRKRREERPRLVVLCDISDSVRHVSRFMLQFAYTLSDLFEKVRSFVFVSELGECTDLFREHDLDRAVELAERGGVINVYANSNYGRSLRMFADEHLDSVTPRTTVIVIGDGRNNYNAPEASALEQIGERARRLLWLNPEPPVSWGFGDSVMRLYAPHCDKVETVNNLVSLKRVVDKLVL